jgi:predicted TIM-barrel fold metal-dependent hydrolase
MDRLGIELAISSHMTLIFGPFEEGLRLSIEGFEKSEGRICWLGVFNPKKIAESIRHLDAARKHDGFLGVKIAQTVHGVDADDPAYRPVWEYAREHGLPILTHSWSTSSFNPKQARSLPRLFEKYIDEFREVTLVFAHAGGRGDGQLQARRLAREYPNVYLDLSGDIYNYGLIEDLVADIGDERILYGSDLTMLDGRAHLARVLFSNISRTAKLKILRENALRAYNVRRKPQP